MSENETDNAQDKDKPETSSFMKALVVILVIIAIIVAGYSLYMSLFHLPFDPDVVQHDGKQLYLVTIGDVGPDAIAVVKANIQREFPELGTMKIVNMPLPADAKVDLGPNTRPPYSADMLLAAMEEISDKMPDLSKAMGIIEEPLYMEEDGPEMDIWGLTNEIGGNYGVVSTTLKRVEIEQDDGFNPGTEEYAYYFDLSLGKSTLHEFGHLMGLNHCRGDIGCPMEISSPMAALEEHGNVYCKKHRNQLRKLYKRWGIEPVYSAE